MGIKTRKQVHHRPSLVSTSIDQYDVDPDDIPSDAPTHCNTCGDELTPLRRTSAREFCTKELCQDAQRLRTMKDWRMVDLHKQGPTVVIVRGDDVVVTSKNGPK